MRKGLLITGLVCIAIAVLAYLLVWVQTCKVFAIIGGVILVFVGICQWIINSLDNTDDGTKYGNYVYYDYDSAPGCWAHNDTLYSVQVICRNKLGRNSRINTDEKWEIATAYETEPEGSCGEYIKRTEVRKNGLIVQYHFRYKNQCWWFPKHDIVRMLFDKEYFEKQLDLALQGDAETQALVGCCYGHNGKMSQRVVKHNIDTALTWWKKASEQGHQYAMRELTFYYWHKGEREEAFKWYEKSGSHVFVIDRYYQAALRKHQTTTDV